MNANWQAYAQTYLARLGSAEYSAGLASHVKRGRAKSTYRHAPSEYHRELVALLGAKDEEGFKAHKMIDGQYSVLGV